MKPEIKAKWIAALRSGEYKQCRTVLTNGRGFCCLGVLTNLYLIEKGKTWRKRDGEIGVPDKTADDGLETQTLPKSVMRWAGLEDDDPAIETGGFFPRSASTFNDGGARFKAIAKLIDKNL